MMKYTIPVVFTVTMESTVCAETEKQAMDMAELDVTESFRDMLDNGMLGVSDFTCEAQRSK